MDLIVTDGHEGLLAAVSALFTATPRQRCIVHKQRNVLNAIPHRERKEVSTELAGIFKQETKEDALLNLTAFQAKYQKRYPEAIRSLIEDGEHLLTFYAFPPVMHRYIRSTNAIESLFSNVGQRTDQIDTFTTETSCLTIVWAVIQDIHLPRIPVGEPPNPESKRLMCTQPDRLVQEEVFCARLSIVPLTAKNRYTEGRSNR